MTQALLAEGAQRADRAARQLADAGHEIRYLDSVLLPVDEVAFYRFASNSIDLVQQTGTHAGLVFERVVEYIQVAQISTAATAAEPVVTPVERTDGPCSTRT